jgi:predicted DNA-binding transcriptional regulator AlpA
MTSLRTWENAVYRTWATARRRCNNPKHASFKDYGARGIEFRFESFEQFSECVGPRPEGHQLDRINNEGHYEPGNVRWVTAKENQRNTRKSRFLEHDGQVRTMSEWSELTGITRQNIYKRLKRGWSVDDALTVPLGAKRPTYRVDKLLRQLRSSPQ